MSAENNGGKTSYYDLPSFTAIELEELLKLVAEGDVSPESMAQTLIEHQPSTLNDLIEYKNMKPWQHEVFKACYALNARAEKNGGSEEREINKIIYFAQRGLTLAKNKLNLILD